MNIDLNKDIFKYSPSNGIQCNSSISSVTAFLQCGLSILKFQFGEWGLGHCGMCTTWSCLCCDIRHALTSMSSDNTSTKPLRPVTRSDAVMCWVKIWPREMIWMEESGSFVKVVLKDMSSLDSASRACQLVSHLTKTTSSLGLQGPTTGKVMRYAFDELLMMFFSPSKS